MSKGEVILATSVDVKASGDGLDLILTSGSCQRTFHLSRHLSVRIAELSPKRLNKRVARVVRFRKGRPVPHG